MTDESLQDLMTIVKTPDLITPTQKYHKEEPIYTRENGMLKPQANAVASFSADFLNYWKKISSLPDSGWQRWFHSHDLEIILRSDALDQCKNRNDLFLRNTSLANQFPRLSCENSYGSKIFINIVSQNI